LDRISRLDDGPPIKNVTGDLAIWCEIGDHGWGCYNRKDNKFEFDGFTREYSHSSTLDVTELKADMEYIQIHI
jgi:hypothetical protein